MRTASTLLLVLLTTSFVLSQQPESVSTAHQDQSSIEGYVLRDSNGEPLENSQVLLTPLDVSPTPAPSAADVAVGGLEGFARALAQSDP